MEQSRTNPDFFGLSFRFVSFRFVCPCTRLQRYVLPSVLGLFAISVLFPCGEPRTCNVRRVWGHRKLCYSRWSRNILLDYVYLELVRQDVVLSNDICVGVRPIGPRKQEKPLEDQTAPHRHSSKGPNCRKFAGCRDGLLMCVLDVPTAPRKKGKARKRNWRMDKGTRTERERDRERERSRETPEPAPLRHASTTVVRNQQSTRQAQGAKSQRVNEAENQTITAHNTQQQQAFLFFSPFWFRLEPTAINLVDHVFLCYTLFIN